MTVGELLERISSLELSEWMALADLEGKEHELVMVKKIDPEIAHRMVWDTDGAELEDED